MNKYIKAHEKLWDKIIWGLKSNGFSYYDFIFAKEIYYQEVRHEFNMPNNKNESYNNCFICDMCDLLGYGCHKCEKMFNLPDSSECLGGLYHNFIDAIQSNTDRAIRLAKIIRDLYKTADPRVLDEWEQRLGSNTGVSPN